MYLKQVQINNIRSIGEFKMEFENPAGWHVIIGDNGAGKSTIVRAIALAIIGPDDSRVLRLNLKEWVRRNKGTEEASEIRLLVLKHEGDLKLGQSRPLKTPFEAAVDLAKMENNGFVLTSNSKHAKNYLWSNAGGWFSAAFGPFRRFTGGEKDWNRVYGFAPRAAAHLSVFGEDVALTEALEWLKELHIKALEAEHNNPGNESSNSEAWVLDNLKRFLNEGNLLPHGTKLDSINSNGVFFTDGNGTEVEVTQMSDGYRSILSLTFELIRQLVRTYGANEVFRNFNTGIFNIDLPGVVIIDEIDAHLHPSWQARIGEWFLQVFPQLQFIVTTHSPIICRASEKGTIWRLRAPGSDAVGGQIEGIEKDRLIYGDLLDAYGTEFFGRNITQSPSGRQLTEKLAELNMKSFKQKLSSNEQAELEHLKTITSHFSDVVSQK